MPEIAPAYGPTTCPSPADAGTIRNWTAAAPPVVVGTDSESDVLSQLGNSDPVTASKLRAAAVQFRIVPASAGEGHVVGP